MNEEARRFDVELFGDVFADFYQRLATCAAVARCRVMTMNHALKMCRQWLPTSDEPFDFGRLRLDFRINACFQFGTVRLQCFDEQVELAYRQRFAFGAKAHAAMMGQFKDQCLDFTIGGTKLGMDGIEFKV